MAYNGVVLIVPGIMGSTISYPVVQYAGLHVWLNPSVLFAGGFTAMQLPIPSEGNVGPLVPASQGGTPIYPYYGQLAAALERRNWYSEWPYGDWRKPQAHDAQQLIDKVLSLKKHWPLRIICHSRGGLLVRRLLGYLGANQLTHAVARVIGLGVPHTGSLSAAQQVSGDNNEMRLVSSLGRILPTGFTGRFLVKVVTGVTRSWPSIYELMPAPGNPWLPADVTLPLYLPATWAPSKTTPVAAYLADAQANWSAVPPVPSWCDWVDVVGVGVPTPGSVKDVSSLAISGDVIYDADGDGVVPTASAGQGSRPRVTVPCAHSGLPIDPRVWEVSGQILVNGLTGSLGIGGPVFSP